MGCFGSSTIPEVVISLAILLLEMSVIISARHKVICQGKSFEFKCDNSSHAVVIYSAKYGRWALGRAMCPFNKNVQRSVILANETDDSSDKALECGRKNVTVTLMRLCDKKKKCMVTANETYFGNPCKGVYKFLVVFYVCGLPVYATTIPTRTTTVTVRTQKPVYATTIPTRTTTVTVRTQKPVYATTIPTRTTTVTVRTQKPTTIREETRTPVLMAQETPEIDLGFTGSLYLWFVHMEENPSAYLTVFLLSAFGAILSVGAAAACVFTFKKKKHFLKLDIIHKPRRFIAAPKDAKKTNQNRHVLGNGEKLPDNEELPDGMIIQKGSEVIFTAHDVNNHVTKEFNIDRYSGPENGTANMGDGGGVHVNPLFSSTKRTPGPVSVFSENRQVSSGPSTPLRSRNLTDPRTETGERTRRNSTGNVSRSHERHAKGMPNSQGRRIRLLRHLSSGNVSSHRYVACWKRSPQTQFPAKTLTRPSLGTSTGAGAIAQSLLRSACNCYSRCTATPYLQSASVPASPTQTNPGVLKRYDLQGTVPYNRQQSNGSVNRQVSPSKSTPYGPKGQIEYDPSGREVEKILLDDHDKDPLCHSTALLNANSAYQSPNDEEPAVRYSPHRAHAGLNRIWSEEKPNNESVPNITTNPSHNSDSRDIWLKKKDPKIVENDTSACGSRPGQGNLLESFNQRGQVSNPIPWEDSGPDKGTMRPASTGELLLSPLDTLQEGNTNTRGLRFPDRGSYNINLGTSSSHPLTPPPPELLTDSSDDDLYSIVAKGTYSSATPDPYLRHSPQSGNVGSGRAGAKKSQYLSVVTSSSEGSIEV